jgi:tetratricopeptide (TPR) repeat protein
VTSTAGDRASVAKQVKLGTLWNDLDFTLRKKEEFWSAVKAYGLQVLPTADLLAAWDFAHDVQEQQAAFRMARELEGRRQELKPQRLYDVAMELARCEHEVERRPDRAEQYLHLALESVPRSDAQRRFDAGLALCDHYFYYLGDPERARREYAALRADFAQADPGRRRMALIRIGDTYLCEGKADEASAAYREAEADPAFVSDQPRAIVVGAGLIEVASYLRRGEGDEALKRLENLLWTYPTMRREGEPTVLRIQAHLVRKDFREAKKQADVYLRSGRDPNFLPAVHVEAAEACIELGLLEEARQHYRKVLDDFPESPQVKDAENGLRRLGT